MTAINRFSARLMIDIRQVVAELFKSVITYLDYVHQQQMSVHYAVVSTRLPPCGNFNGMFPAHPLLSTAVKLEEKTKNSGNEMT